MLSMPRFRDNGKRGAEVTPCIACEDVSQYGEGERERVHEEERMVLSARGDMKLGGGVLLRVVALLGRGDVKMGGIDPLSSLSPIFYSNGMFKYLKGKRLNGAGERVKSEAITISIG